MVRGTSADDEIVIDRSGPDYRFTITTNGSTIVETAPLIVGGLPTNVIVEGEGGNDDLVIGVAAGPQVEFLGDLVLDSGSGDDAVFNASNNIEVVGSLTILTGNDNDTVDLSGSVAVTGDVVIETGAGVDDVAVSGAKGLIDTEDDDGSVVITNYIGETLTILGGTKSDVITVSGNGVSPQSPQALTIDTKDSKDFVTLDNSSFANLTVRAGKKDSGSTAGFDEVSIQNSTVYAQATFDVEQGGMRVVTTGTTFWLPVILLGV